MKNALKNGKSQAGVRLLKTPEPLPDESLIGYILRLTAANYYESPRWIFDLAGLSISSLAQGWRASCNSYADLNLFGRLTGLTTNEMERLRHRILSEEMFAQENCDIHSSPPINDLNFDHPKICSECLRESAYCRKLWDLRVVTVCPRHRVMLLDRCPACSRGISWTRKSVCRCRCGFDWRKAKTPRLEPSQCRAMEWLQQSLSGTRSKRLSAREDQAPFQRLGFYDLSYMLLYLAEFFTMKDDEAPRQVRLENHQYPLHQALEDAVTVFDEWPAGFHRFCEYAKGKTEWLNLTTRHRWLADHSALAFLRAALDERLEGMTGRRFLPASYVQRLRKISSDGLKLLRLTGRLQVMPGLSAPHLMMIDERQIDKLLEGRKHLLTVKSAARKFGIRDDELLDLIYCDCLPAASGPHLDGFPEIGLEFDAVRDFYCRIEGLSEPESDSLDIVKLEQVNSQLRVANLSFGQWMRAVLDGEITPLKRRWIIPREVHTFLTDFAFRKEQCQQYLNRHCPTNESRATQPRQPPDQNKSTDHTIQSNEGSLPAQETPPNYCDSSPEKRPAKNIRFLPFLAMTILVKRKWDNHRVFTRHGVEMYDVVELSDVAKMVLQRFRMKTHQWPDDQPNRELS